MSLKSAAIIMFFVLFVFGGIVLIAKSCSKPTKTDLELNRDSLQRSENARDSIRIKRTLDDVKHETQTKKDSAFMADSVAWNRHIDSLLSKVTNDVRARRDKGVGR